MPKSSKQLSVRIHVTSPQNELTQTVAKLQKAGMRVESVLDMMGVITGEIAEDKLAALKKNPGFTIEREQTVQLPSPDAPVQ